MLKIIFSSGVCASIDLAKKEADEQIEKICASEKQWITINTSNNSTTYNKKLIALMESVEG